MKRFTKELTMVDSRMLRCAICLFLVIIQLSSCKSTAQRNSQESNDLGLELLLNENYSGFEEEQYILIKNQKELNAFYGIINRTRKPGLTPPSIDFTTEMILIWCGNSSASSFANLKLIENDEFLKIHKLDSNISKKESKLVVSPFSMYKLPLSAKTLKIEK